jgi:hypothetical protein
MLLFDPVHFQHFLHKLPPARDAASSHSLIRYKYILGLQRVQHTSTCTGTVKWVKEWQNRIMETFRQWFFNLPTHRFIDIWISLVARLQLMSVYTTNCIFLKESWRRTAQAIRIPDGRRRSCPCQRMSNPYSYSKVATSTKGKRMNPMEYFHSKSCVCWIMLRSVLDVDDDFLLIRHHRVVSSPMTKIDEVWCWGFSVNKSRQYPSEGCQQFCPSWMLVSRPMGLSHIVLVETIAAATSVDSKRIMWWPASIPSSSNLT